MNTESADCRNVERFEKIQKPGDFYFADRDGYDGIVIILPGGSWAHIPIVKGAAPSGKVWGWNGDKDRPSLTPSIHCLGSWHGYLTGGRLFSC